MSTAMDQIEFPSEGIWNARRDWFEREFDIDERGGGYIIGEQATALLVDLQAIFCAGAFISVLIISCTILDSHLREAELGERFDGGMQAAFEFSDNKDELGWLRKRRNELVHFKSSRGPVITVDDHYALRDAHEVDARRAIKLVASVLFENPWV